MWQLTFEVAFDQCPVDIHRLVRCRRNRAASPLDVYRLRPCGGCGLSHRHPHRPHTITQCDRRTVLRNNPVYLAVRATADAAETMSTPASAQ